MWWIVGFSALVALGAAVLATILWSVHRIDKKPKQEAPTHSVVVVPAESAMRTTVVPTSPGDLIHVHHHHVTVALPPKEQTRKKPKGRKTQPKGKGKK